MVLTKYIDHTVLKSDTLKADIVKLCQEAIEHNFKSVCINPSYIKVAKQLLDGSSVLVCTVIGFPLGQNDTETKVFETVKAIENGADEVDMVINIAKLKDKEYDYVLNEIKAIKKACGNKVLKVIIETCLLTDEEKEKACELIIEAKADFVKTSTGFSHHGATFEDVALLKNKVKDMIKIKAAGGIKSYDDLIKMIELGADRIGTSSAIKILNKEIKDKDSY